VSTPLRRLKRRLNKNRAVHLPVSTPLRRLNKKTADFKKAYCHIGEGNWKYNIKIILNQGFC
jgi:hypothetical protein